MICEISQKDEYHMILLVKSKNQNKCTNNTEQEQTHTENKLLFAMGWGGVQNRFSRVEGS